MKVFFYSHSLYPGGAEKQCALIAAEIKQRYGYESVVILNNGSGIKPEYAQYLKAADVAVVVLPQGVIKRGWALLKLFRAHRDAVLFNYLTGPDCWGALMARMAGLRRIVGGIETDRLLGVKFMAEKIVHTFLAVRTICNSYRAYDYFSVRGFDRSRLVVMPSAMAMTPESESAPHPKSAIIRVVCVGRFCIEKDYATWVRTIASIYAQHKSIRATIVGYGGLESEVRAQVKKCKMEEVITILPGQTTEVKKVLLNSDIYLSTSIREGTSNTILEAMDAALPAVVTDVGDNARMVEDCKSGFVCTAKDVEGLTVSVLKLIEDANLRQRFGHRAREILKERYSLEKIAADYDALICSFTSDAEK